MVSNLLETHPEVRVPSYEESQASRDTKHAQFQEPSLSLPARLADTRTQRIESILSTYVDPLLLSQGVSGLYKTTFLLIPSSVSSLQDAVSNAYTTPQEPQVVGFPTDEVVKLLRLKGEEHSMEFWRQPAVLRELESSLKARLVASGHRLHEEVAGTDLLPPASEPRDVTSATPPAAKKSLWGRAKTKLGTSSSNVEIVDLKLGWRAPEQQTYESPGKIPTGLVDVSLVWKELCLRIANEMGLYETQRGPGLCITVEVGS